LVFGPDGMTLFGTTIAREDNDSYGTVFSLDPTTKILTKLYTFGGGTDGSNPAAALVLGANGALYGTTSGAGGPCFCGTIFEITP
jgi:uncharacterized repeat protein (TIGR03803 family)